MLEKVAEGLKLNFSDRLVDELLIAFREAKQNYYVGGLRLSAVEGGRFCEAAYRMLQERAFGSYTKIGDHLNTNEITTRLAAVPAETLSEAFRLHIPRALRVVYDIRNKRNAAHLADDIDPNKQDATLIVAVLDWILAEFVRHSHKVSADEAQAIISDLIERKAPAVQEFGENLLVLNTDLKAADCILVILYERGSRKTTLNDLVKWVPPRMRKNIKRTLSQMHHDRALIHEADGLYQITRKGLLEAERRYLVTLN